MIYLPLDRLQVFVSSTIEECAEERRIVREAIESTNHQPVLFEQVGARPRPPREVYRQRLQAANVFIGVYRESYGWIGPNMTISGIEDEFTLASRTGIDRLVYVLRDAPNREPQLRELIERAKAETTVAFYKEPEDLRARVRDDLTAVISSRFVDQPLSSLDLFGPTHVLESIFSGGTHQFERVAVERSFVHALERAGRLLVTAPLGGGKTVLLAQLSARHDWLFVDGRDLNRLNLMAGIANSLRATLGKSSRTFSTESAAVAAIRDAWASFHGKTLIVDGATEPQAVWDLMPTGPRLVVSARQTLAVPPAQRFRVPALDAHEIESWVGVLRGVEPGADELQRVVDQSGGNPLYLRFYARGERREEELSLQQLEIEAFEALSPRARELVSYLSLANVPLAVDDLVTLLGADHDGVESVVKLFHEASAFVQETARGVSLVHEHPRHTLVGHLHDSPTRLSFFAIQLGAYLARREDYVRAFLVLDEASERRRAGALLARATHQVVLRGGGTPAIPILQRRIEQTKSGGHVDEELVCRLHLAQVLSQVGHQGRARQQLEEARALSRSMGDPIAELGVREAELALNLSPMSAQARVSAVESLRDSYSKHGDDFHAARTATFLAAAHILAGGYAAAEAVSREALEYFTDTGDTYGQRVARVNLLAALSGIEGRMAEAELLAEKLESELDPSQQPRERAVVCNVMTRRFRRSGNPQLARRFAKEAIQIGKNLGDHHLVAINSVNLGNVERDQGSLEEALEEYRRADLAAVSGGRADDEAVANHLIASVLNELGNYSLAAVHAQHSVGRARSAQNTLTAARAYEELAIAHAGQREVHAAIDAYGTAVSLVEHDRTNEAWRLRLVCEALVLAAKAERGELSVRVLTNAFLQNGQSGDLHRGSELLRLLYAVLPRMARSTSRKSLLTVVALCMSGVLVNTPPPIERRIVMQSVEALLAASHELPRESLLLTLAAILLASDWDSFSMGDLVDIAENTAEIDPHLHFKPQPNGAAHWTVRVGTNPGVLVTVEQLDGNSRTSAVAFVVVCLFTALGDQICSDVIGTAQPPRAEAIMNVANRTELEAHLGPVLTQLGELEEGFALFRSTDPTHEDQPPFGAVCEERFGTPWTPASQPLSDVHMLFAELLVVLASHVLAEELEREVIEPKVARLLTMLSYRGSSGTE